MIVLLSIGAVLFYLIFVLHFGTAYVIEFEFVKDFVLDYHLNPFNIEYGVEKEIIQKPVMYLNDAFSFGFGAFAFIMNMVLLTILVFFLIYVIKSQNKKNPFIFLFVGFFSLINTILFIITALNYPSLHNLNYSGINYQYEFVNVSNIQVPGVLIAIIVFSILATLYMLISSICLFVSGRSQYRSVQLYSSSSVIAEKNINVGDIVKTCKSHLSGSHLYPIGTKGKVIEAFPRSVIILIEEPTGNKNKIPMLKSEVEKVE